MTYYHRVVVHLLRYNVTLPMLHNFPTAPHRLPEETQQDCQQQLSPQELKIICNSTTHLVQYQTYQMTLIPIQIQIRQILIHQTHLIHWNPEILNATNIHQNNWHSEKWMTKYI